MVSGPFGPNDWRSFVDQSLDAVEALHEAGWIHGDLNADNFFRADSGWKLLELPFSRFDPPEGALRDFGSIHTLAPEQIDGAQPDVRSDLYALGSSIISPPGGQIAPWPANRREIAIDRLRFRPICAGKRPDCPGRGSLGDEPDTRPSPSTAFPLAATARQLLAEAVA